jgi:hypothetical protein
MNSLSEIDDSKQRSQWLLTQMKMIMNYKDDENHDDNWQDDYYDKDDNYDDDYPK